MPLDSKGNCCGKPVLNKMTSYQFCRFCDRAYNEKNDQIPNWAWEKDGLKWVKIFGERPPEVDKK